MVEKVKYFLHKTSYYSKLKKYLFHQTKNSTAKKKCDTATTLLRFKILNYYCIFHSGTRPGV